MKSAFEWRDVPTVSWVFLVAGIVVLALVPRSYRFALQAEGLDGRVIIGHRLPGGSSPGLNSMPYPNVEFIGPDGRVEHTYISGLSERDPIYLFLRTGTYDLKEVDQIPELKAVPWCVAVAGLGLLALSAAGIFEKRRKVTD